MLITMSRQWICCQDKRGFYMVVSESIEFESSSPFIGTINKPVSEQIVEPFLNEKLNEKTGKKWKYKCHTCKTVTNEKPCPQCGEIILEQMCELDHIHCSHEVSSGIKYCPKCGQPVCPEEGCFSHDVFQLSRVTGYYANISSFNNSKRQEVKDRVRGNLSLDGQIHRIHS